MKLFGRVMLSVIGALLGTLVAVWWIRHRGTPALPEGTTADNIDTNWITLE